MRRRLSVARAYRIRVALMSPYQRERWLPIYLFAAALFLCPHERVGFPELPAHPNSLSLSFFSLFLFLFRLYPPDLTLRGTTCHPDPAAITVVVVVVVVIPRRRRRRRLSSSNVSVSARFLIARERSQPAKAIVKSDGQHLPFSLLLLPLRYQLVGRI